MEHTWEGVEKRFAELEAQISTAVKGDKGDKGEPGERGEKGEPGVTTVLHKMHDEKTEVVPERHSEAPVTE